jgi:flagellin-specific chaperone FliS
MSDLTSINESYFDAPEDISWLRLGWRGIRTHARRAKQAIIEERTLDKIGHIAKAEKLIIVMQGILPPDENSRLAMSLRTIYQALHGNLLKANSQNSVDALNDLEVALNQLDRDFDSGQAKEAA